MNLYSKSYSVLQILSVKITNNMCCRVMSYILHAASKIWKKHVQWQLIIQDVLNFQSKI